MMRIWPRSSKIAIASRKTLSEGAMLRPKIVRTASAKAMSVAEGIA
jgi:hypothetical protein